MFKSISVSTPRRVVRVGWLSLQPDHSISFGLQDKTYISPYFEERIFIWNAYNRVQIEYLIPSEPDALVPVKNPHFTYHPRAWLQLTSGPQGPKKQRLFEAIADIPITLAQDRVFPWIRATSKRLQDLPDGALRVNHKPTEDLVIHAPSEDFSISMAVDFVAIDGIVGQQNISTWKFECGEVGLRLETALTYPQISTLSWYHSY